MVKKVFEIKDWNSGDIVQVTIEEVVPSKERVSIMDTLEEDIRESWDNDDLRKAGIVLRQVRG